MCLYPSGTKDALSTEDLPILMAVCCNAAPHWKDIGVQLGIDVDQLTIISGHPLQINEGIDGYFREMLTVWLKHAPPKHRLPSLEFLAYALRMVGEERLALDLPKMFLQVKGLQLCL